MVVLSLYWNDHVCSLEETMKWRTYALIAAARMTLYISSVTALYLLNGRLSPHTQIMVGMAWHGEEEDDLPIPRVRRRLILPVACLPAWCKSVRWRMLGTVWTRSG